MFYGIDKLNFILEYSGKKYDTEKINRAYEFAKLCHEGQFRVNGEEYITHPIAVAEIVAGLELDTDSICAALLHDTLEDCPDKVSLAKIKSEFGDDVAMLVDGLTKLVKIPYYDREEMTVENLRKMFFAMAKDIRVVFIKLCDRLHNMRTLQAKTEEKQRITALETMHIFAPLAHRLGIQRIKQELENLALEFLDPIGYKSITDDIEKRLANSNDFFERTRNNIIKQLSEHNIKCSIEGRVKSAYSIYKKMYNQNKSFDEIYDFYAFRIIVDSEKDCYTALGIMHDVYNSIPGRFKDYISTPKPNLYRSLHTTVIGRDGIPFEVQIRTWEMHHIAEYGIAAHWKYKSGEKASEEIDKKLAWVARLIENEEENLDPGEFFEALKIDIFQDETFVFTPKGDVIALPATATAIDFAYSIHSAVGNRMIGAKVNGAIVPIDRILQNGEIVEIITSSSAKGPSRDWIKIAKTSEARTKIRQWFKKEKRAENISAGKAIIDAELKKYNINYTDEEKKTVLLSVAQRLGISSVDDFYNLLGFGGISLSKIIVKIRDEFERTLKAEMKSAPITDVSQVDVAAKPRKNGSMRVLVDGKDGCAVKFAKCCNPLPGDDIVGFITKGFGISVHKADCLNVAKAKIDTPDRFVRTDWDGNYEKDSSEAFEVTIRIEARSSLALIADITRALADMHVPITQISSQNKNEDISLFLTVAAKSLSHYSLIASKLRAVNGVLTVERGHAK